MTTPMTKVTNVGRARITNSIILGEMLSITRMALASTEIIPSADMVELPGVVWTGNLTSLDVSPTDAGTMLARLSVPVEAGTWTIRSAALLDDQDNLIAVASLAATEKEAGFVAVTVTMAVALTSEDIAGITLIPAGPGIQADEKGQPGGVATLDNDQRLQQQIRADKIHGVIPAGNLPSYVDDVIEYVDVTYFPVMGETGKIYVDLANNSSYRWSGSVYIKTSDDDVLQFASAAAFPVGGIGACLYIAADTGLVYRWNGADYEVAGAIKTYATSAAFPVTGVERVIYIDIAAGIPYFWNGADYVSMGGGSAIADDTVMGNQSGGAAMPYALNMSMLREMLLTPVIDWVFPLGAIFNGAIITRDQIIRTSLGASAVVKVANAYSGEEEFTRGYSNINSTLTHSFKSDRTELLLSATSGQVKLDTYGNLFGNYLYGLTLVGSYSSGQGIMIEPGGTIAKYSGIVHLGKSSGYYNTAYIGEVFTYCIYEDWYGSHTPNVDGMTEDVYERWIRILPGAGVNNLTLSLLAGASAPTAKVMTFYFAEAVRNLSWSAAAAINGAPSYVNKGDTVTLVFEGGQWLCVGTSRTNLSPSLVVDASGGGTITPASHIRAIKLTGAAPAALTIDCVNLPEGVPLVVYSVNGVTALTIAGGANLGALTTLAAAGIGHITRCSTELIVS